MLPLTNTKPLNVLDCRKPCKDACGEKQHRCSTAHRQSHSCPYCQLELTHRHLGMKSRGSKPNSFSKSQNSTPTDPQSDAQELKTFFHLNLKKAQPCKLFLKRHSTRVENQQSAWAPNLFPDLQHALRMFCWVRIGSVGSCGLCRTANAISDCSCDLKLKQALVSLLPTANSRATLAEWYVGLSTHSLLHLPSMTTHVEHTRILLAPSADALG